MIKKGDVEFATFLPMGSKDVLPCKKKCRPNTLYVDNVIKLNGACNYYPLTRWNRKKFYFKNLKTFCDSLFRPRCIYACGWDLAECGWDLAELWIRSSQVWMRSSQVWMTSSQVWMRSGRAWMRSSQVWIRSSRVVDEIEQSVDEI
jgi:hypothetical protein